jgi:hypothetical protein
VTRLAAYTAVATALDLYSDRRLGELLAAVRATGSGIGGSTAELEVEGVRVFVKKIPLTDLERRSEHLRSTANLFGLPPFYQYPLGSAGFGAWRELAAHVMTTNWVLGGGYQGFPLLYGWRVLPGTATADAGVSFLGDIEATVAHWDGSAAVRRRVAAIGESSASLVLFCEYIPHRLSDWLRQQEAAAADSPFASVDAQLTAGVEFMNSRGFTHFYIHFNNVLTDGELCYFADFGLATSDRFELTDAERAFCSWHRPYDRACAATGLVCAMIEGIRGSVGRRQFLAEWGEGSGTSARALSPGASAMISRYAPLAVLTIDFHRALNGGRKTVPFPAARFERLLAQAGTPAAPAVSPRSGSGPG